MVSFKSHCSLPLDPNTLHLAFRYPLVSFSLNSSTFYSPLQFYSSVYFSSWVSVTCLLLSQCSLSKHNIFSLRAFHWNCSVLLDPVFSSSVHLFFVLFNSFNNHWISSFVPFILHMFCSWYTCYSGFSLPLQFSTIYLSPQCQITSMHLRTSIFTIQHGTTILSIFSLIVVSIISTFIYLSIQLYPSILSQCESLSDV